MKKLATIFLAVCLFLTVGLSMTACNTGSANIGEYAWKGFVHSTTRDYAFDVFDCQNEKAYYIEYVARDSGRDTFNIYAAEEYTGDNAENFRITSIYTSYRYVYRYREGTQVDTPSTDKPIASEGVKWYNSDKLYGTEYTPIGGKWLTFIEDLDRYSIDYSIADESFEEIIAPVGLYRWVIDYAANNYSAFDKTGKTATTLSYKMKNNKLSDVTAECQKYYDGSSISELTLTFDKNVYSESNFDDGTTGYYGLGSLTVKDQNGLLFVIKNNQISVSPENYEMMGSQLKRLTNYTIKMGDGVDYGEYYFTEDAVKIYTPNNADADKREGYLIADRENETAKYASKKADGTWNVQEISISDFESRKSDIVRICLNGIINCGHSGFKRFYVEKYWTADKIVVKNAGYDEIYSNVEIMFDRQTSFQMGGSSEYAPCYVEKMSYDYTITSGSESLTYRFELTDGGSTVVNVPSFE